MNCQSQCSALLWLFHYSNQYTLLYCLPGFLQSTNRTVELYCTGPGLIQNLLIHFFQNVVSTRTKKYWMISFLVKVEGDTIEKYIHYLWINICLMVRSRASCFSKQKPPFWGILRETHCTKKWSFPLRISSANVTKSAGSCRFGQIYWRNP